MAQRLTDDQKESIIIRYEQGLNRAQITTETGISEGSVNRIISAHRKRSQPKQIANEAQTAIAQVVTQALRPESVNQGTLDTDGSLIAIINAMVDSMGKSEPRSSEGCAAAATRAIALYRQFHPQTMEELADQLLALPDFEPTRFVQILRERIKRDQA